MALREVTELEEAVKVALDQVKITETLIIVTADHSHSFTMNGYPKRGNDILGFANNELEPQTKPYETLTYANGPGFVHHKINNTNSNATWISVDNDPTRSNPFYQFFSPMYLADDTHGGEDVGVYAIGKKIFFTLSYMLSYVSFQLLIHFKYNSNYLLMYINFFQDHTHIYSEVHLSKIILLM